MGRDWRHFLTPKSLETTRSLLLLTTRQKSNWAEGLTSVTWSCESHDVWSVSHMMWSVSHMMCGL